MKVARLEEHAPVQEMTRTKLTVAPKGCPREPARVAFLGGGISGGAAGWPLGGMGARRNVAAHRNAAAQRNRTAKRITTAS